MKSLLDQYLQLDMDASIPLATQLSQQLSWLIISGKIRESDSLPPVRSLGEMLGINYHTVRAAYQQLKDYDIISTRQGKLATVKSYNRQYLASHSPKVPTFTIGVLLPNYSPYHASFLEGLEVATKNDPWLKFICNTNYYTCHVGRYMDQLIAKNVDGIVVMHFITPFRTQVKNHLETSDEYPPIVYADSPGLDGLNVCFMRKQGAYDITKHLIEHGHARIAMITPSLKWSTVQKVYSGYRKALTSSGLPISTELIITVPTFKAQDSMGAVDQLLELADPPTAILASGDMLAIGAMKYLKEKGVRVPEDMAVAGFGECDFAKLADPPLTTVALPPEIMGIRVMEILRKSIAGEVVDRPQILLDTHLVIRQSCGCL